MIYVNLTHSQSAVDDHPSWKNVWDKINNTYIWGCVSYLYKKYGSPDTYQEFLDSYINDECEDDPRICGRSLSYIIEQAKNFKDMTGDDVGIGVYVDYIIKKLIIDTLNGQKWENLAKKHLEDKGFTVVEPDFLQDTREGIDKIIYKNDHMVALLQVKPHSFFIGNHNKYLVRDRKSAIHKQNICRKKYNVPVIYYIYNKHTQHWVSNPDHGLGFQLDDLINPDGTLKPDVLFADYADNQITQRH